MSTSEIATVLAWHDALNSGDLDTLVSLSSDDVEIGDAHGAAQGHVALRRWARGYSDEVADGAIEVGRIYYHDGVVVVEETLTSSGGEVRSAASAPVCWIRPQRPDTIGWPPCCGSRIFPLQRLIPNSEEFLLNG